MSGNYEHDQERLINSAASTLQTSPVVGTQLWMTRSKPLKVELKTASQDVRDARKAIDQGTPKQKVIESIRQGEVYRRIAKAGGNTKMYEQLIVQRAEIDRAVEIAPTQAVTPVKNRKKTL